MTRFLELVSFEDLRIQAKQLLELYEQRNPAALQRLRISLPAAAGKNDQELGQMELKLQDAQRCIALEHELPSWDALRRLVEWQASEASASRDATVPAWLHCVYGIHGRSQPELAARIQATLAANGVDLVGDDLQLACAVGEEKKLRAALAADPGCVNRIEQRWRCPCCGEWLDLPPLLAVTHSGLLQLPAFHDELLRCARFLLDQGADPNQTAMIGGCPLSALYGAAGKNHDAALTRMLLEAGADPNDGESLYHAMESRDLSCARLLLEAGARVEGSNALHHQLDRDDSEGLRLLLEFTADADDKTSPLGSPLLWAIRRGRSRKHIEMLLAAGANPRVRSRDGISAYRLALQSGLGEVAEALRTAGAREPLTLEDQFVSACARCDEAEARRVLGTCPGIVKALNDNQLRQLPNLTEARNAPAVRLMVELGWPIGVRGGDWEASALNLAVFQGDAALTRFLLEHGASWQEEHGHGDNVHGTLAWASCHQDPDAGDWVGCAQALVEHGMPVLELEGEYSAEVEEFLGAERRRVRQERTSGSGSLDGTGTVA